MNESTLTIISNSMNGKTQVVLFSIGSLELKYQRQPETSIDIIKKEIIKYYETK